MFLATSDIHLKYKLRISREQCLEQARESVRLAKSFCNDVEFSPEDATRTDRDFLCQVVQAVIDAGATTVNIPDTVGYTMPAEFAEIIQMLRERVRGIENVTISVHCHNDLGLAVANTMAALAAGARQVECTINGIGERAGNASLEEIVMATRVRPDRYAYDMAVVSEQLYPASQTLSEVTGVPVQPNKAIIGRNAFAHEAGIHQDGVLKNPLTYEIMTPQSVGVPDSRLVLGKHSGRHALSLRCEQLGYHFERRELDEIYRTVRHSGGPDQARRRSSSAAADPAGPARGQAHAAGARGVGAAHRSRRGCGAIVSCAVPDRAAPARNDSAFRT